MDTTNDGAGADMPAQDRALAAHDDLLSLFARTVASFGVGT